jgi:plastocyanin
MKRFPRTTVAAALLLLATGLAWACGGDNGGTTAPILGQIEATVMADGAAAAGVTLRLFEAGGTAELASRTTTTGGVATFGSLDPGSYDVEVEIPLGRQLAAGEQVRKSVNVVASQTASVDFALVEGDGTAVEEVGLTANFVFTPAELTISAGTTVRWVNQANVFHTITPDGHTEWSRATVEQQGDSFSHTFDTPGVYPYFCEPHQPTMTGTITVQ